MAPGNVTPLTNNIIRTTYGANAVTQTAFPVLLTPFHNEKYTKTKTEKTQMANVGFIGPI